MVAAIIAVAAEQDTSGPDPASAPELPRVCARCGKPTNRGRTARFCRACRSAARREDEAAATAVTAAVARGGAWPADIEELSGRLKMLERQRFDRARREGLGHELRDLNSNSGELVEDGMGWAGPGEGLGGLIVLG